LGAARKQAGDSDAAAECRSLGVRRTRQRGRRPPRWGMVLRRVGRPVVLLLDGRWYDSADAGGRGTTAGDLPGRRPAAAGVFPLRGDAAVGSDGGSFGGWGRLEP